MTSGKQGRTDGYEQEGDVVLLLRFLPDRVPGNNRLRRLLKLMLRSFGIRVLRVGDETSLRDYYRRLFAEEEKAQG